MKLEVGAGGALAWVPQETILFDQMRLARTIDVELARGASLLLAEAVVFGRSAMGEAVVRQLLRPLAGAGDGTLVFAETVRLGGAIAPRLRSAPLPAAASLSPASSKFRATRPASRRFGRARADFAGEVGASGLEWIAAWRGSSPPTAPHCTATRLPY